MIYYFKMTEEIIIPEKEIGKLSASKLTTYFGCSLAFVFHYILHIRIKESIQLIFGNEIHYMLKLFYDKNFKSKESYINFWKHRWNSVIAGDYLKDRDKEKLDFKVEILPVKLESGDTYELRIGNHVRFFGDPTGIFFGYKRLGESILGNFYDRLKNKPRPILYEKRFTDIEFEGHILDVRFDRVDEKNGKIFITDYKTDKHSPGENPFLLHRHPQFTLYSKAYRLKFNRKEDAILYYHLRSGKVFKTKRSEKDFEYLLQLLNTAGKRINERDFTPFYGWHCNLCGYQPACGDYSVSVGPELRLEDKVKLLNKVDEVKFL